MATLENFTEPSVFSNNIKPFQIQMQEILKQKGAKTSKELGM
jgi:hypothetical protein